MNSSNKKGISPTKGRRDREKEQRRQDIIEVAEKLFFSQGFENTTMEQIAIESEYSKGTLYNYYNSKDELFIAIGNKAYNLIIKYSKEFTEKEQPGIKQLMAVGYAYYEFTKDYPNYASIFHNIALKLPDIASKPKGKLSDIEKEYLNLSNTYRDIFIKNLNEAIQNKAIRADKNPFMIGYVLSTLTRGLVEDLMQLKKTIEKRFKLEPDEVIDFAFEIIGDGLKPREL
ncbi:MAG: TetR/AcrR family transcriptional regulator [Candidatus Hodarchaeota archaeon]